MGLTRQGTRLSRSNPLAQAFASTSSRALAQRDFRVGLLDADVYGPSVPRLLSLGDARLRWNAAGRIEPAENFGIKVMSVGMTTPAPDRPLIWRSSVSTSAMIQLLTDVDWGELDFLVIDMPPGSRTR